MKLETVEALASVARMSKRKATNILKEAGGVRESLAGEYYSPAERQRVLAAFQFHQAFLEECLMKGEAFTSPQLVKDFLKSKLRDLDYEVFSLLLLDNQHRLIKYVPLFRGTIDGAAVYPREVVKMVLDNGAAAVILAHNHPSGLTEPSPADRAITKKLVDALGLIDVRVLDHIIVGENCYSFAESGLL